MCFLFVCYDHVCANKHFNIVSFLFYYQCFGLVCDKQEQDMGRTFPVQVAALSFTKFYD